MSIAVIGSANIDLSVIVPKMPENGETIKCVKSQTSPGGKGANQAVAAAKIGAQIWMLAKVGRDIFGEKIVSNLKASGVDTDEVIVTDVTETGKAFILVSDGDNRIVIDGGCNDLLSAVEIEKVSNKILKSEGVLLQNEIPVDAITKVVEICKGKVPIFINPAPAEYLSETLLEGVDYFTPNEIECEFYTGIKPVDERTTEEALKRLSDIGIRYPLITLGKKGVAFFDGKKCEFSRGFVVEVVDSTAAGDTFSGVFAAMILNGMPISSAVNMAQAAAAITCTRFGAQSAVPTIKEVKGFLNHQ